jgi:hypothetical protein
LVREDVRTVLDRLAVEIAATRRGLPATAVVLSAIRAELPATAP